MRAAQRNKVALGYCVPLVNRSINLIRYMNWNSFNGETVFCISGGRMNIVRIINFNHALDCWMTSKLFQFKIIIEITSDKVFS